MNTGLLIVVLGILLAAAAAFVWVAMQLQTQKTHSKQALLTDRAEHDVEHIFNDTFREELRNRGRLHFEQIIGENAMFLQQDLRLTTSQLNEFMKNEISSTLKEEFSKYEQSIADAKQLAIDSIVKTQEAIEQQRTVLAEQLDQQFQITKKQMIEHFQNNMADIINHYLMTAIGDQIALDDQLEYILKDLETHKEAIVEDITSGA